MAERGPDDDALARVHERLGEVALLATPDGRLRAIEPGARRLFERAPEALVGLPLEALFSVEDRPKLHAALDRLREGSSETLDTELRLERGAADPRWARLRLARGDAGFIGSLRDMHARRMALESERWLFDAGPVIAFRWANAPGWPIEEVSRNVRQLGWSAEELVAERRPYSALMHPDDLVRVGGELARYLAEDAPTMHFSYRLFDAVGRTTQVDGHAVAERDATGAIRSFRGYVVDASARRTSEATRARAEQDFQTIIENSVDLVLVHRGGRVLFVNAIGARRLGWDDPSGLIGTGALALVDPADRDEAAARIDLVWRTGAPSLPAELRLLRRDGALETFEFVELKLGFRGAPAVVALGRDVTERRRLAARIMQVDRMVAVGTLATGVAHEINNPLAVVLANLGFVLDELRETGADQPYERARFDELVTALDEAKGGAERVRDIVLDLKALVRSEPRADETTELAPMLRSAISLAQRELQDCAEVELSLPELPAVNGPAARLGQVFLQLLVNAAQAMPRGAAAANVVRVSGRREGAQVVIEVADTGVGIAPDHLPQIFDPFFTTRPAGRGTGLGLSICQGLLKALGGEIGVRSTLGVGTTFTVRLPIAPRDERDAARAQA